MGIDGNIIFYTSQVLKLFCSSFKLLVSESLGIVPQYSSEDLINHIVPICQLSNFQMHGKESPDTADSFNGSYEHATNSGQQVKKSNDRFHFRSWYLAADLSVQDV